MAPLTERQAWSGHAIPDPVQTTTKPQVPDLGLFHGAGDENRTRALSLGSSCSTIKLHPRSVPLIGAASSHTLPHRRPPACPPWGPRVVPDGGCGCGGRELGA
jgi:hypothetical protein